MFEQGYALGSIVTAISMFAMYKFKKICDAEM